MRELSWRHRRQLFVLWADPIFRDRETAVLSSGYARYMFSWRYAVEWLAVAAGLFFVGWALLAWQLLPGYEEVMDLAVLPVVYLAMLGMNLYAGARLKRRASAYLERHPNDAHNA